MEKPAKKKKERKEKKKPEKKEKPKKKKAKPEDDALDNEGCSRWQMWEAAVKRSRAINKEMGTKKLLANKGGKFLGGLIGPARRCYTQITSAPTTA